MARRQASSGDAPRPVGRWSRQGASNRLGRAAGSGDTPSKLRCDKLTSLHSDQGTCHPMLLPTCCQHVANLLPTCCQPVANLLPACCQPVANLLPPCCQPTGCRTEPNHRPRTRGPESEQWGADAKAANSPGLSIVVCKAHARTHRAAIEIIDSRLVPPPTSPFFCQWHPADPMILGIPLHQAIQCCPTPRGSVRGHVHRI